MFKLVPPLLALALGSFALAQSTEPANLWPAGAMPGHASGPEKVLPATGDGSRGSPMSINRLSPFTRQATILQMSGAPLVEIELGKGSVIASEMMLSSKAADPVAGRLLRNLLQALYR